jgi:glutathione S-transferase
MATISINAVNSQSEFSAFMQAGRRGRDPALRRRICRANDYAAMQIYGVRSAPVKGNGEQRLQEKKMKLYWSPLSPYARKVMIAAHECGLADKIERLRPSVTGPTLNADLLAHNPLHKMPTLVCADGTTLYDSVVIVEYLDSLASPPRLFPPEGPARWDALRWHALGNGFIDLLIAWRFEGLKAHPDAAAVGKYAKKADAILAAMDADAAKRGEAIDVGDIAAFCAVGYLDYRFADLGWPARAPNLVSWRDRFADRPSARVNPIE